MATGSNPSLTASGGNPAEFGSRFGLGEELGEHGEGAPVSPAAGIFGIPTRRIRQGQMPVSVDAIPADTISVNGQILQENLQLRSELRKAHEALLHSKIETADLYSKFGEFAKDWAATIKELNAMHENQRQKYEEIIKSLLKENNEMKKVIENLNRMKTEFDKQKRLLRLGQIGYQLDILASEYVFPGENRASKRARYGTKLKSLKGKIDKLQDQKMQEEAKERMNALDKEMFEDWFLGMVDDMKKVRVDTAHPDLGTYEEMVEVIKHECKDDDDKRDDMLVALKRLEEMYQLVGRPFGK